MHVEGPQISWINRQTNSFQNMYAMLKAKIDRLARKLVFKQQTPQQISCWTNLGFLTLEDPERQGGGEGLDTPQKWWRHLWTAPNMLNTVHSHNNGQTCCFHIQHWGWIWSQCLCPCIATVVHCFQIKIPLGNVLNSAFEISDALDRAALILLLLSALCQLILFVLTWMLIFCHWLWCWWLSYSSDSCFDSVQEYWCFYHHANKNFEFVSAFAWHSQGQV